MGRFMVQLFGSRKEPWVESATAQGERTEITDEHDDQAIDNEKTTLVDDDERERLRVASARDEDEKPSSRAPTAPMGAQQAAELAAWSDPKQTGRVAQRHNHRRGAVPQSGPRIGGAVFLPALHTCDHGSGGQGAARNP